MRLGASTTPEVGGTAQLLLMGGKALGLFRSNEEKKWNNWERDIKFLGKALNAQGMQQEYQRLKSKMELIEQEDISKEPGMLEEKQGALDEVREKIVEKRNEFFEKSRPIAEKMKEWFRKDTEVMDFQKDKCAAMSAALDKAAKKLERRVSRNQLSKEDVALFDKKLDEMQRAIEAIEVKSFDKLYAAHQKRALQLTQDPRFR